MSATVQMTATDHERQEKLTSLVIKLRSSEPFFGTLVMYSRPSFAREVGGHPIDTACADGMHIYFNPDFFDRQTTEQNAGLLVHEALHNACLHGVRRGLRDPKIWNIAADISINGKIEQGKIYTARSNTNASYQLPFGGVKDPEIEDLSTEEIYAILRERQDKKGGGGGASAAGKGSPNDGVGSADGRDLYYPEAKPKDEDKGGDDGDGNGAGQEQGENDGQGQNGDQQKGKAGGMPKYDPEAQRRFWGNALRDAETQAKLKGQMPAGMERILETANPKIDWRTQLWSFVKPSRDDFDGYRRSMIYQDVYLDEAYSEKIRLAICLDTSGSVGSEELADFHAEVLAIQNAYPAIEMTLYHCDARLYGPHEMDRDTPIPKPRGGGGTDFRPFFDATKDDELRVYITDGYGDFPTLDHEAVQNGETLWVIAKNGLKDEGFPFGETIRLY